MSKAAASLGVALAYLGLSTLALAGNATATPQSCSAAMPPSGVRFTAEPRWVESAILPPHCEIRGLANDKIRFVMRLPGEWEGRFLLAGCGGFCGEVVADRENLGNGINAAVRRGYAAVAHDGGHDAPSWETAWASDPDALEIWAHKVLPLMTAAGTAIAQSVYGTPPRYKYFSGCSNGGRLGMIAAQRYPGLFDGVAAGASISDVSGTAGLWGAYMTRLTIEDGKPVIAPDRWRLVHEKILARCDSLDGRRDGRLDRPRDCPIDFDSFTRGDNPLTSKEVAVLKALYSGVRDAAGKIIYPGMEPGAEFFADIWLGSSGDRPAWGVLASRGYIQMLNASLGEPTGLASPDINTVRSMIARSSVPALTDAMDTDLRPFAKSGGKLLMYHGLADPLIIPQPIEDYYTRAAEKIGGLDTLRDHARLFMIPGWGHCWERPTTAADGFDPLAALESWVERGDAPNSLPLRSRDGASVEQIPMR